jgi:hypothetical protein
VAENGDQSVGHRFAARSRRDDQVHLVNAPLDAVVDPSAYTTHCGQPVAEIDRDGPPATCPACADAAGGAPAAPQTSNAERRTGEHVL